MSITLIVFGVALTRSLSTKEDPSTRGDFETAEQLPFEDRAFDATLAQLVVHFMSDPVVGLREMARVTREGDLGRLFREAGLHAIEETTLCITVEHPSFDDWWEPFTLGVGPAGAYVAGLDVIRQGRLRERCRDLLPRAPFAVTARAWAARGFA